MFCSLHMITACLVFCSLHRRGHACYDAALDASLARGGLLLLAASRLLAYF